MSRRRTKALVLGGGGVAGIAWETGIAFGLAENGVRLGDADLIVGTSAGSTFAAQLTSGTQLADLYDRHVFPAGESTEIAVDFDPAEMAKDWAGLLEAAEPGPPLRAAIGAFALAASTPPERRRREVVEARLPSHEWPAEDIRIVAVDAATGEERVFTAADGVSIVDVVAASCAVPGVWPPVTIEGRRYIDGGVRSVTNVDLAAGHDVVVVLAPIADFGSVEPDIAKAAEKVQRKAKFLEVRPDAASLEAIGLNPLDPAAAKPAAMAGRAQGAAVADEVREIWADRD